MRISTISYNFYLLSYISYLQIRQSNLLPPPSFAQGVIAGHRTISIPAVTVMAVVADFHRSFLIPDRKSADLAADWGEISPELCYSFCTRILYHKSGILTIVKLYMQIVQKKLVKGRKTHIFWHSHSDLIKSSHKKQRLLLTKGAFGGKFITSFSTRQV